MEMLRSFRGDKHEFCLAVIKFNAGRLRITTDDVVQGGVPR